MTDDRRRRPGGDDGFGPVLRGGGTELRTRGSAAPSRVPTGAEPTGYGPVARGRHRRWSFRRLGKALLALALVATLVVVGTGVALAVYASLRINRVPVRGLDVGGSPMNVLVVGSDSREGLSPEELQALGTEAVAGRRTDTIFLLSISGGRAAMLSLPRDLYVTRCDGSEGRINGAFATGGPSCLVDTVTRLTGIPLSHYVEVNFAGFLRTVDAVGGVPVYLEEPMQDVYAGVDLPAGCVVLDGEEALGFVRARKVDNDLGRIARQQRFLRALAGELTAPSTLLDVPGLFRIAGTVAASLTADTELGVLDLLRLGRAARGLAGAGLATYTVPAEAASIGGAAVLEPIDAEAEALFERFRTGAVLEEAPASGQDGVRPEDVTLQVLNGAGVEGLAARGAAYFTERGFAVSGVGNAAPADESVVRYPPGMEGAARLVAEQLPGTRVEPAPSGQSVLTVVLGSDVLGSEVLGSEVLGSGADLSDRPAAEPPPDDGRPPAGEQPDAEAVGAGPVPERC